MMGYATTVDHSEVGMMEAVSIVPDRLAHYRVPVFNNISKNCSISKLTVYADLRNDSSGIKKCSLEDLEEMSFFFHGSRDIRIKDRLLISTGSIKAAVDKSRVVVIWGDAFCPGNWLAVLLAKFWKKKIIFWTHGLYGSESRLRLWVRCLFYSTSDSILLYGNHAKNLLIKQGFSEKNLYVINNALDLSVQDQIYNRMVSNIPGSCGNSLKLIFVGRLTRVKKLHILISAVKKLKDYFDVRLDVVGGGVELDDLVALSEELGISDLVVFHGAIYDEEQLARLIMSADITVSPGNVGLTAMHSLVYGTPVISHDNAANQMPEFEAIVPGVSGGLFKEDELSSLVESVLECKEKINSGSITRETCRKVLKCSYSLDYQKKIFDKCLSEVLGYI